MKCKKCRKEIPDGSKFCNHCGAPVEAKKKLYRRPDGLYEKIMIIDGKRVAFRAKKEAEVYKKIREYENAQAAKEEHGELFADIAKKWDAEHAETLSPTTEKGYRSAYNDVYAYFADDPIKDITPKEINAYMKRLPKTYARKTCGTRLSVLNMIFKYAVVEGYTDYNPCENISVPKGHGAKKRRAPTDEEVKKILSGAGTEYHGMPVGLLALFLYYTGLRKGEALALQYRDIDRDKARASITKSVYYVDNAPKLKEPKTEAGVREIVIPDCLLKILPNGKKNAYLFCEPDGALMREHFFRKAWERWQKETGLDLTAHQLRHGYASILLEADVAAKDAQDLLGHADISTTLNIYTDVRDKRKSQTQKRINEYLQ